jgi:hypothetical protein
VQRQQFLHETQGPASVGAVYAASAKPMLTQRSFARCEIVQAAPIDARARIQVS